ncbi:MAG TPA: hypothetical protein VMV03_12640 [Spirochaetia bacterium]|nr:hypothetical protein [Spirochaetia bacterium]
MADGAHDFPTLESESGITPSEREEIRTHIEKVATENRIPVEAAQFSLPQARRGVLMPTIVNAAAVLAVLVAALVLTLVFRHGERRLETQATQYASVEGRLIRELRAESDQQMSSKQKEIDEVRQKLRDLEQQQQTLEQTFNDKLRQKEAEFKALLKQEVEAERARLLSRGLGQAELDRQMQKYEAERRTYYERQLADYRKQLEAQKRQVQADIDRLRSEYTARLDQLQKEQRQIVADYQQRESNLRVQLEQKTQVMERLRTQNIADLEAAQRELARLTQVSERTTSVENQIDGLTVRIRDALVAADTAGALTRVHDLQGYLRQDAVRNASGLGGRIRTETFFLNQLESTLNEQLKSEASAGSQSLTSELELLGRIRDLSKSATAARTDEARLEAYRGILSAMPEVKTASDAVTLDAAKTAVDTEREAFSAELQSALTEQAANASASQQAVSTTAGKQISDLMQKLSLLDASSREQNARMLASLAARARTTPQNLDRRIDDLNGTEDQLNAIRAAFATYVKQDQAARAANPADAMTASRQELNKFLRDEAVRRIFSDMADRVNALYTATQTAGSSAALANASEIIADVAKQPTLKAGRQLLEYELGSVKDDAQLKAMLTAIDDILAKAQAAGAP